MSRKRKIMIIDDDAELLTELGETLMASGYDSEGFSDGDEALKMVGIKKPDLILLDLKMNGKNGFQIADTLKHMPETASIPIIAMTGYYTEKQHTMLMYVCGIQLCVTKPFNPLDIIAKIEALT